MDSNVIGVDIGGSHIKSALVDIETGLIQRDSIVNIEIDRKAASSVIFRDWAKAINQSIDQSHQEIAGIGFAMPGPFNYQTGIALFKDNDKYENLFGLRVEEHLRPLINVNGGIPFRFHNDASCFAIGADGYGVSKDHDRSISITLGTGFGSAFIDQGVPIVVREDVPEDGCLWHLPFKEGIGDEYFSTRWFVKEYQTRFGNTLLGVKDVAEQATTNPSAQRIFDDFGINLAEFLSPWIQKFAPSVLVIGGNISKAFDLFSISLQEGFSQNGLSLEIKVSTLQEDAALIGSARLLNDDYFSKLSDYLPTK